MDESTIVRLITWNAGPGNKSDLDTIMRRKPNVLAGQEWQDRDAFTLYLKGKYDAEANTGMQLPKHLGLSATPLFVFPEANLTHKTTILLLPRQYIGPGAGPDHNKDKGAVGGLIEQNHIHYGALSTHWVASSYKDLREKAAEKQRDEFLQRFNHRHFPWFMLGDLNCEPDSHLLNPFRKNGWTNTYWKNHEWLKTHENRTIDYIFWQESKYVELLSSRVINTHSDHKALEATFEISRMKR